MIYWRTLTKKKIEPDMPLIRRSHDGIKKHSCGEMEKELPANSTNGLKIESSGRRTMRRVVRRCLIVVLILAALIVVEEMDFQLRTPNVYSQGPNAL